MLIGPETEIMEEDREIRYHTNDRFGTSHRATLLS